MASSFRWMGMSPDGNEVVLRRFDGRFTVPEYVSEGWLEENREWIRSGAAVDVETTGLGRDFDKVIEIGLRVFQFDERTGHLIGCGEAYSGLEDPGFPIPAEIKRLTGITDEDVAGQKIRWDHVSRLLGSVDVIVAHNAAFDRGFIDRYVPESASKLWACSCDQIDWTANGFSTRKLELLNIYHGFFTDAHRALHDAEALVHLLSLSPPGKSDAYLKELYENARRPRVRVIACGSPYETKDLLKSRGYSWNVTGRFWHKAIFQDSEPEEREWLTKKVYAGKFAGRIEVIALHDNFK